ncbi:MAG: ribosome biogenesis GTP-binding protein YihA/YsxC [Vicinamibacterales bacterium]
MSQRVVEFVTSAAGPAQFPRERLPEVALVGRSNVGKSSLINALARRSVARTSAEPGKTRLANFYRVQQGQAPPFFLVDLPGFGYARASRVRAQADQVSPADRRQAAAEEFSGLIEAFFARPGDRGALLLVDARHPGLESDAAAWAWLQELHLPLGVVGTKVDKLTRTERVRHARELETVFRTPVPLISAARGEGLDALWTLIARLPRPTVV